MKVVILCGGLGTRLREETEYRPKPMVPIGGLPILWHIMKLYSHFGHREFILCLGYKGEVIKEYFRNYHWNRSDVTLKLGANPEIQYLNTNREEDWTVTMIDTGLETMTGGRLGRVMPFIEDETFLLTYGDGLSDVDINETIRFHRERGSVVTLTAVHPTSRFGELRMDGDVIEKFHEKPEEETSFISGGFFVMNREIGGLISGDDCVLEHEPMETVARQGKLSAFRHRGFWQCMDTYREQQLLESMWRSGDAPWKVW